MPNINPIILTGTGGGGGINYSVDVFTSSGTWNKPANLDYIYVLIVSGGGGGGSGRRGAASTNRGGGQAANGAAILARFNASDLNATESVTVGADGTGGAAQTLNTTNGIAGTTGGASNFKHGGTFQVAGGLSQAGGANIITASSSIITINITGNRYAYFNIYYNSTRIGNFTTSNAYRVNDVSNNTSYNLMFSNTSVGGQINSSNDQLNSGGLAGFYNSSNVLTGEMSGTLPETNGIQPTEYFTFGDFFAKIFPWFDATDLPEIVGRGGLGGGCGNTAGTIAGGTGANAIGYGAGGGGGGASTNGANSGAGGNGSTGIVIIINVLTS
jgi:hypothetical protein